MADPRAAKTTEKDSGPLGPNPSLLKIQQARYKIMREVFGAEALKGKNVSRQVKYELKEISKVLTKGFIGLSGNVETAYANNPENALNDFRAACEMAKESMIVLLATREAGADDVHNNIFAVLRNYRQPTAETPGYVGVATPSLKEKLRKEMSLVLENADRDIRFYLGKERVPSARKTELLKVMTNFRASINSVPAAQPEEAADKLNAQINLNSQEPDAKAQATKAPEAKPTPTPATPVDKITLRAPNEAIKTIVAELTTENQLRRSARIAKDLMRNPLQEKNIYAYNLLCHMVSKIMPPLLKMAQLGTKEGNKLVDELRGEIKRAEDPRKFSDNAIKILKKMISHVGAFEQVNRNEKNTEFLREMRTLADKSIAGLGRGAVVKLPTATKENGVDKMSKKEVQYFMDNIINKTRADIEKKYPNLLNDKYENLKFEAIVKMTKDNSRSTETGYDLQRLENLCRWIANNADIIPKIDRYDIGPFQQQLVTLHTRAAPTDNVIASLDKIKKDILARQPAPRPDEIEAAIRNMRAKSNYTSIKCTPNPNDSGGYLVMMSIENRPQSSRVAIMSGDQIKELAAKQSLIENNQKKYASLVNQEESKVNVSNPRAPRRS